MKPKIILPLVVLLIVAVFTANGIYGNKIAKEIDTQLKIKIAQNELPVSVVYSKVKVNPMFSTVKIVGVSVSDLKENGTFRCKSMDFDIPYNEALRLLESTGFEQINSFNVKLVQPELLAKDSTVFATLKDLTVDFDGHLTKADFENIATQFPDQNQELQISFSGLKIQLPGDLYKKPPFSELLNQFTEIDKGSYTIVYSSESEEFQVKEASIESPVISYKGNSTFKFVGNSLRDFKPEMAVMKTSLLLRPKDFEWKDKNGNKGEFSLGKLRFDTNSKISFENKMFPEGEMKLEIVDLKMNYGGEKNNGRSMLNLSFNNLDIQKLDFNYLLNDKKLSITDSQIISSLIEATVFADVDIDQMNPANSTIKEATVRVKKLAPDLEKLLNRFEQQMGKDLPREDGVIVLELSGKLTQPTIKGFEL